MYVMLILMAFSLGVSLIFLGAYIWSVKSGQFDDKYTPSVRMLFEDKKISKKTEPGLYTGEKNEEIK